MPGWTDAQVTQLYVTMAWVMGILTVATLAGLFGGPLLEWARRRQILYPWGVVAGLLVGGVLLGAIAGQPLIGLVAGLLLGLLLVVGRAPTPQPSSHYVNAEDEDGADAGVSAHGKAENEISAERESAGKAPPITAAQLTKLLEDERRKAVASALGTLLGSGLIVEKGRTRAMVALFGPAGRGHTDVRPIVAQAEAVALAARPPEPEAEGPPELLVVRDGAGERLIAK